jgi:hypothetical protein
MPDRKCAHESCTCNVRDDAKAFCSDACREARNELGRCLCGHASCAVSEDQLRQPLERESRPQEAGTA